MSNLKTVFDNQKRRLSLIPFITAGFPTIDSTVPMMKNLVAAGGDIIELGIPFSDPMADGLAIQRANAQALKNGITFRRIMQQVEIFRRDDEKTPVVLMGYMNSFYNMKRDDFTSMAADIGLDGVIIVDAADSERRLWQLAMEKHGIDLISLIAPTTPESRLQSIIKMARGFLYYISLRGITGAGHLNVDSIVPSLQKIKAQTTLPLAVGFGVREADHALALSRWADGIVIGSRLVEIAEQNPDNAVDEVAAFIAGISQVIQ